MKKNDTHNDQFIADGRENILDNNPEVARIREEIIKRYSDRLAQAGFFRKILLQRQMHKEIEKEINKLAPPDALYLHNK